MKPECKKIDKICKNDTYLKTFNIGDTKYHGGLRSRELCQAPIMQALSSHLRV